MEIFHCVNFFAVYNVQFQGRSCKLSKTEIHVNIPDTGKRYIYEVTWNSKLSSISSILVSCPKDFNALFWRRRGIFVCISYTYRSVGRYMCIGLPHLMQKIRQKKNVCFRSADRPYISYDTFSRKLLKYPIFALQCSFWCPREDNF